MSLSKSWGGGDVGGLRVCDPGFCAVTFEHGCVCPPGEGWEVGVGGARIMHVHARLHASRIKVFVLPVSSSMVRRGRMVHIHV